MTKKSSIIFIISGVLALTAISVISVVIAGERSLTALAIFGAIFLPSVFVVRLIVGILMALKRHKEIKK